MLDRIESSFVWGLLAFVGCGGPAAPMTLRLPSSEAAASFLLLVDQRVLYAGSVDTPLKVEESEATHLVLAYYSQGLAELGLGAGPVSRASCRSCALLEPLEWFASDGSATAWRVAEPFDQLVSLAIPDGTPRCQCPTFETEIVPVPGSDLGDVAAALKESPRSVLLVYTDGAVVRITDDLQSERLCSAGSRGVRAAALGGRGLWVTYGREVLSLDLDSPVSSPCTVTSSAAAMTPDGTTIWHIAADARDVVTITRSGEFQRLRDGAWTELGTIPPSAPDSNAARALIVSPGVYLAGADHAEVIWHERGVSSREVVEERSSIEVLATRDGVPVAATSRGIAVRDSKAWRSIDVAQWTGTAALEPFLDGFLITLDSGAFTQLSSEWELCEGETGFGAKRVYNLARLGDASAVFADIYSASEPGSVVGVASAKDTCQ